MRRDARISKWIWQAAVALLIFSTVSHAIVYQTIDPAAPTSAALASPYAAAAIANAPNDYNIRTPNPGGVAYALPSDTKRDSKQKATDQQERDVRDLEPMSEYEVRRRIIETSIIEHGGSCACPYSENADGFQCGTECAYYEPGGYRIHCYKQDIRPQLYIFYRKTH